MNKTFATTKQSLVKNLVLIDGFSRSGKFFLGKIVSGLEKIEYFQAISALEQIPFLYRLGGITEDAAVVLLKALVDENAYNMRIGRNLNLRYYDASSLYNSSELNEYLKRTVEIFGEISVTSKKIIASFQKNDRYSLFVVHEVLPNIELFFKAYPRMKVINLIRHPIDIIHSWYLRGWGHRFADDPLSFTPVINGPTQPVPWYAYKWEREYEESSEMDRIIKSIAALIGICTQAYQGLSDNKKQRILFIRYENLVENTPQEIKLICSFLNTEPSEAMPVILAKERCPRKILLAERIKKMENIKKVSSKKIFDLMMQLTRQHEDNHNPYDIQ